MQMLRMLKLAALALIRWYLRRAGRCTRDGLADGGYIVWMSADDYHRYSVLVYRRTQQDFYTIVWAAREKGVRL